MLLLREHDVQDAAPWLQRDGVTSRKHLLDVTEEDVQAAGLQKYVALRFVRMLAGLRVAAAGDRVGLQAPHLPPPPSATPPLPAPYLEAGETSLAAAALAPLSLEGDELVGKDNASEDVVQVQLHPGPLFGFHR